jgi:hypothetical protein
MLDNINGVTETLAIQRKKECVFQEILQYPPPFNASLKPEAASQNNTLHLTGWIKASIYYQIY